MNGALRQLRHFIFVEFVECARHKQIALLAEVALLGGAAQTHVAVALTHDRFALAQQLGIKAGLREHPVPRGGVVHQRLFFCHTKYPLLSSAAL